MREKSGLTTIEVLVVVAILSTLLFLALPIVGMATEWGRRRECANNLRQISHALLEYEHEHKCFPGTLSELYPEYIDDEDVLSCPSRLIEGGSDYAYHPGYRSDRFPPCILVDDRPGNHSPTYRNILRTDHIVTTSLQFREENCLSTTID